MKCSYKARWFSSKGACLVLLWTLLIFTAWFSLSYFVLGASHNLDKQFTHSEWAILVLLFLMALFSAPLSGWLADTKFGNYNVFRAGAVLLFISMVLNCLVLVLEALAWNNYVMKWIHLCICGSPFIVGSSACIVTALPLGLDQMPDASSSSITSYIAWFVCSIFAGDFLGNCVHQFRSKCLNGTIYSKFTLIWALGITLCMTFVLVSNFLFNPKWLIIEPKSPQSLKTIYRVLKFATKHKAPLNRSAFTYWEEDIPSRLDLGKSKYGGPFTIEQVEDVKTVLRLLAISFPLYFLIFSSTLYIDILDKSTVMDFSICRAGAERVFASSSSGFSVIGVVACELVIHPLVGNRFTSILKRIGTVSLMITLVSLLCFIIRLAHYLSHSSEASTEWIVLTLNYSLGSLLLQILLRSMLEFMSAQSPYNMRGLLASVLVYLLVTIIGTRVNISHTVCTKSWCFLIPFSVKTIFCVIGFLLFCVVAHWYKRRVRDDDYSPHRVVEEVYDRYLTAAAAQSRSYDTHKH